MGKSGHRKRANLRDVATAAGVSVATVSRVLNSPHTVAEQTRERVDEAIRSLQWVPSAAARAINSGRTRFVGALVPTLDHDIFARVLAGLERQLACRRLSLVVATTDGDPQIETSKAKGLIDIGAEGLIISGKSHAADLYSLIERTRLPTVATSCYDPDYALPTIGYDNARAACAALAHLAELGHRRIAVLHGPKANNDRTRARIAGLTAQRGECDLTFLEVPLSTAGGCEAVRHVLKSARQATALLCLSDVLAAGAMFELQRQGITMPERMSVMGIDDLPDSACLYPALTTIHLPVSRMGRHAADAIASWVETEEEPASLLLDFNLVVRGSTTRPREPET
ncbi:LacI family DNA-binding transcriptional regulator [Paracoccus seriniphilus]|uniref:Transcriptional regulator, LacI family n=1 Tax=Paracoccus seriniphilus TaxID=184748 RepID=A0A239PU91_9RHOB|nr:LacI family DNA-binding transcriptional regulator [Paracoccus seriniphilus]WCR15384.1 LacI family DNA-binding transcriptional regulator [Paracoccus seriniphilus]SNT73871.1 transcriptional regulator, LacI family [Paracoccus seriniphilus]